MSDTDGTPTLPPPTPPRSPPRSGCLTAFMVIFGIILLLPGLCAMVFGAMDLTSSNTAGIEKILVLLGLMIGAGGVALIVAAIRGRRS